MSRRKQPLVPREPLQRRVGIDQRCRRRRLPGRDIGVDPADRHPVFRIILCRFGQHGSGIVDAGDRAVRPARGDGADMRARPAPQIE